VEPGVVIEVKEETTTCRNGVKNCIYQGGCKVAEEDGLKICFLEHEDEEDTFGLEF
jgi:hypothetical protein